MRERGGGGGRDRGWAETQRILKTFAVLLIFFSKWVKLFYDFHRQFPATGNLFFLPPPPLSLSRILSHRCSAWRRHVHLARLIFSSKPEFSLVADSRLRRFSHFTIARILRVSHLEIKLKSLRYNK